MAFTTSFRSRNTAEVPSMAAVSTPMPNHCRSRACRCLPNLWNSLQGATMVRLASPSIMQKKHRAQLY